jgi:hypothetical protein
MRLNKNTARRFVRPLCRKMIGSSEKQSTGQDTEWRNGFDAEFTSAVWMCREKTFSLTEGRSSWSKLLRFPAG